MLEGRVIRGEGVVTTRNTRNRALSRVTIRFSYAHQISERTPDPLENALEYTPSTKSKEDLQSGNHVNLVLKSIVFTRTKRVIVWNEGEAHAKSNANNNF
jgi:hypothetical protein